MKIRSKPSAAMIVAVIALVFAMIGTGFAALGKNSVGTKQLKANAVTAAKIKKNAVTAKKLKKNAVTTAKIKNEAVTGTKVNESTLGTVPSATVANSLSPLEATHLVGAPGEPGFESGSFNFPGEGGLSFNPVGFYKDHEGIVHLQGIAQAGKTSPAFIFTLPPGFRPAAGKLILQEPIDETQALIAGSNINVEGIDLSGKVLGAAEKPVVLDTITFRAES